MIRIELKDNNEVFEALQVLFGKSNRFISEKKVKFSKVIVDKPGQKEYYVIITAPADETYVSTYSTLSVKYVPDKYEIKISGNILYLIPVEYYYL